VVRFYNKRGTAEQWIKEGKQATHWTRLSCHRFRANEVRLQLSVLAYNLGNLCRRLMLPKRIDSWSLTSLQQRLVKTGARLVKHARYYWLLLAEAHLHGGSLATCCAGLGAPSPGRIEDRVDLTKERRRPRRASVTCLRNLADPSVSRRRIRPWQLEAACDEEIRRHGKWIGVYSRFHGRQNGIPDKEYEEMVARLCSIKDVWCLPKEQGQ
jgi:Transposase DDE domain group 1